MKIAIVINHFQPLVGYQEYFLAKTWLAMGHEVVVITSNYQFPFPNYEKTVQPIAGSREQAVGKRVERGITTIRLPSLIQVQGLVFWVKGLLPALVKEKPDVVFADGMYSLFTLQTILTKLYVKVPYIFDTHASTFNTNLYDSIVKKLFMFFLKLCVVPLVKMLADGYTAVGTSEKETLITNYGLQSKDVSVILLGADTDLFKPSSQQRTATRKKLKFEDKHVVFVHAGKLTPEKNVTTLIEAFAIVAKKHRLARLLLIGSGTQSYLDELQALLAHHELKDTVVWLPPQPNEQLPAFYNAADIGVWPGNLSNTMQEAMACGLPIILSKNISESQSTDHLVAYNNGLQVKKGNSKALSEAMQTLLLDKKMRATMGKQSLKLITDTLSWEQIAKRHLEVYNQAVVKHK